LNYYNDHLTLSCLIFSISKTCIYSFSFFRRFSTSWPFYICARYVLYIFLNRPASYLSRFVHSVPKVYSACSARAILSSQTLSALPPSFLSISAWSLPMVYSLCFILASNYNTSAFNLASSLSLSSNDFLRVSSSRSACLRASSFLSSMATF
jgi:hypothetical protein